MTTTRMPGWRRGLGSALFLVALLAVAAYCYPPWGEYRLDPAKIAHRGGNAYAASIAGVLPQGLAASVIGVSADSPNRPSASKLMLFETDAKLGPPHSPHAHIEAHGRGTFSHWGNELVFSASDGSDPRNNGRVYAVRLPLPPASWAVWFAVFGAIATIGIGRVLRVFEKRRAAIFWSAAAAVAIVTNIVFHLLLAAPVVSPDSNTYLTWSLFRTLGYPFLLFSYHFVVGTWQYVPAFQLNLLLAAAFVLAYALVCASGSYGVGWLFLCMLVGTTTMLVSAADLLTEAPFAAFAMVHVGSVILYLTSGHRFHALAAGLALAAAIAVKSVGAVLLGPLLLVALLHSQRRRALLALALAPALLAWFIPSAYNYSRYGTFETSHSGGFALAGHVAWAIRPADGGAANAEAALVERSVAPVLARRPAAYGSTLHYVSYTGNEYNELLWGSMVPALETFYSSLRPTEPCDWAGRGRGCIVPHTLSVNRTLVRLSREAIVREPRAYASHVSAHFYGMWRDVLSPSGDWLRAVNYRADALHAGYDPAHTGYAALLAPLPPLKLPPQRWHVVMDLEASPAWRLFDLLTLREAVQAFGSKIAYSMPYLMLATGLAGSLLLFWLARLSPAARAFCYCALCLNAYFLGTALAQPSLVRYAAAMQGPMAAMLLLAAHAAWRAVYDPLLRRESKPGVRQHWRES